MRFYDIYSGVFFSLISENFGFYKGFPKLSIFRNFGGKKLKILKFRDIYFIELVILHPYWSFCVVGFKTLFLANFLTLSRFWSKTACSDPTKTSISQKNRPTSIKFCHSMSN